MSTTDGTGRVYYNKLIRDGIQEHIEKTGGLSEVREISDDHEFEQELLKKVGEEASALARVRKREDFLDEYADLMMVLDTLTSHMEISEAEIKIAIDENVKRKGLYKRRHFLHWSSDNDYKSNETPQGLKL